MLQFSKKIHYALIALVYLTKSKEAITAKEIANKYNIPAYLLANIMKTLANANIVASKTGKQGGYTLLKSAEEISVAEIVCIMENLEKKQRHCCEQEIITKTPCQVKNCPAADPIINIYAKIDTFLHNVKLSTISVSL